MNYDFDDGYNTQQRGNDFWGGMNPGVRSAMILWVFLGAIAIFHGITGGISAALCYPVQLLLYAANGVMAGYFALNSGYRVADLPRVGAIAGLVAWILPALFFILFDVILGLVTLGVGFLGLATWLLCGPIDLAIQIIAGALGAWLMGRIRGEDVQIGDW
jgi:hypothetical protein